MAKNTSCNCNLPTRNTSCTLTTEFDRVLQYSCIHMYVHPCLCGTFVQEPCTTSHLSKGLPAVKIFVGTWTVSRNAISREAFQSHACGPAYKRFDVIVIAIRQRSWDTDTVTDGAIEVPCPLVIKALPALQAELIIQALCQS